jgi:hypothetical protein
VVGNVVAQGKHGNADDYLYVIENSDGIFIMGESGLELAPLDSAKERYELASRMCKMGACSPNSKRKNTCPFVEIDRGGFGCLIYAVANPETQKIMEDYLAREQDKPAEPKQVVKLYCVKDYKPSWGKGFGVTKGKVYKFENGDVRVDNDGTTLKFKSLEDFMRQNPTFASCLVPLVQRPARISEYILPDGESKPVKVVRDCLALSGCLVTSDERHISARKDGGDFTEYLVLSGYKGE